MGGMWPSLESSHPSLAPGHSGNGVSMSAAPDGSEKRQVSVATPRSYSGTCARESVDDALSQVDRKSHAEQRWDLKDSS